MTAVDVAQWMPQWVCMQLHAHHTAKNRASGAQVCPVGRTRDAHDSGLVPRRTTLELTLGVLFLAVSAAAGCGSGEKQTTHCDYQKVPCMSRDEFAEVFTYMDGWGEFVSIDEGPWIESGVDNTGGASCCYEVTYKSEDGMG